MLWLDKYSLRDKWRIFVTAYIETQNATKSAGRAGYQNPGVHGHRLLKNDKIRAAIDDGLAQIQDRAMMQAEDVLRQWVDIATADPNDLVQHIYGPCRYCYGFDHQYQWKTPREYREAFDNALYDLYGDADLRKSAIAGKITDPRLPSDVGGYGYRCTGFPNPYCPECSGLGVSYVRLADTRNLTGSAWLLYNGIEETRQGKRIKFQDRARALENIAKYLGMFAGNVIGGTKSPLLSLGQKIMDKATTVPVVGPDSLPALSPAATLGTTGGKSDPEEP